MADSQRDSEEYVYLTEEGDFTPKLELAALWTGSPVRTMVTIAKTYSTHRESLAYLPLSITESMEKYSLFGGLTGLTACNIRLEGGGKLPSAGEAGKYLKTGDVVSFDVESRDLWLSVDLKCPEEHLAIAFEAKVCFDMKILKLRAHIFEYAMSILRDRNPFPPYTLSDFPIYRSSAPRAVSFTSENIRTLHLLRQDQTTLLDDNGSVREYFSYSSSFVTATLKAPCQPLQVCSLEFAEEQEEITPRSQFTIRRLKIIDPCDKPAEEPVRPRSIPAASESCHLCVLW